MGAAFMMLDNEMRGETLAGNIRELYENEALRTEMHKSSRGLGRPDACSRIVDIAMSMVKNSQT
jgi:UDP-N-acetylglucosamine:LPS N-acetylglucosamine transferase